MILCICSVVDSSLILYLLSWFKNVYCRTGWWSNTVKECKVSPATVLSLSLKSIRKWLSFLIVINVTLFKITVSAIEIVFVD